MDRDQGRTAAAEVRLWDLRSRQVVGAITGFNDSIFQLAFSPGDQLLATVTQRFDPDAKKTTGEIKLWDVKTRKEQRSFPGTWMAFSPNGTTLAVVGNDGSVALSDLGTGQVAACLPELGGRKGVAFSRDGRRLCDGHAVWDVADGQEVCVLKGNFAPAEFSPDGMRLFSLRTTERNRGFLGVWDAATGDLLASIPVQANDGLSLHPDGWRCAVASVFTGTWIVDARPLTPELRRKLDAHNLIAHLVRKPMLKDEILDQLPKMKTISEPLRQEALALAAALENPSEILALAALDIVKYPDRSEDQYRRALRWLEEANWVSPNDEDVVETLGVALYRLGRFEEAAVTLKRSFDLNKTSDPVSENLLELIFLAMAQHRLGREEEARKTLAQARDPKVSRGTISSQLWREAEGADRGQTERAEEVRATDRPNDVKKCPASIPFRSSGRYNGSRVHRAEVPLMTLTLRAVYEGGVLRPVQPLALDEGESVDVTVSRTPPTGPQPKDEVTRRLEAATSIAEWVEATKLLPADDGGYDIVKALNENRIWSGASRTSSVLPCGHAHSSGGCR